MKAVTYLSKSAFAAHIGRSPSYITWLKENGRLVLSPNGKQVDVLATEALIRDTADPSKAAVAARHHQERLQRDVYSHVAAQSEPTNMAAPPPADSAQGQTPDFQKARAHREHYLARMAEMEFRKAQGELVEVSFVQKAAFETARSLNQSLMSLSPQLAPQLAALSDPWEVERQLTAALRQRLNEAAQMSSDDFGLRLEPYVLESAKNS